MAKCYYILSQLIRTPVDSNLHLSSSEFIRDYLSIMWLTCIEVCNKLPVVVVVVVRCRGTLNRYQSLSADSLLTMEKRCPTYSQLFGAQYYDERFECFRNKVTVIDQSSLIEDNRDRSCCVTQFIRWIIEIVRLGGPCHLTPASWELRFWREIPALKSDTTVHIPVFATTH